MWNGGLYIEHWGNWSGRRPGDKNGSLFCGVRVWPRALELGNITMLYNRSSSARLARRSWRALELVIHSLAINHPNGNIQNDSIVELRIFRKFPCSVSARLLIKWWRSLNFFCTSPSLYLFSQFNKLLQPLKINFEIPICVSFQMLESDRMRKTSSSSVFVN